MSLGSKNQYFSLSLLPIVVVLALNIDFFVVSRECMFSFSLPYTQKDDLTL
jgi:hypothetical protein